MALTPRFNLDEGYPRGMTCAVCGATSLKVSHLKSYPDFVVCSQCGSGFVVEDGGDHVLYGNISEKYPHARELALRRWALPEDVAEAGREDRGVAGAVPIDLEPEPAGAEPVASAASAGVPIPSQPEPEPPTPWEVPLEAEPEPQVAAQASEAEPVPDQPLGRLSRLMASSPEPMAPLSFEPPPAKAIAPEVEIAPVAPKPSIERREVAPEKVAAPPAPSPEPVKPSVALPKPDRPDDPNEPPVGQRSRVVIKGEAIKFPSGACAHCMRSPAPRRLTILASTPYGQTMGQRRVSRFTLPLCNACYRRATARAADERAARVQAHLIAALIALGVLVASLALNIVNPDYGLAFVALILVILLAVGYALPAMVLLGRVRGYATPPDAAYVRTTVLIPEDIQGLETPFEWRNARYAERFFEANRERVLGVIVQVKDRAPI